MILHIVGVNHFDPLGRERLVSWLLHLSKTNHQGPVFVAVEYKKKHFDSIRSQRDAFRNLLHSEWPDIPNPTLDALAMSLGYEGDSYEEVFPCVEVLWLDEDREVPERVVEMYAKHRLNIYRGFVQLSDKPTLSRMSATAWNIARHNDSGEHRNQRDSLFAQRIIERCSPESNCWGIVIVGHEHASKTNGSMRTILEQTGMDCRVKKLDRDRYG